MHIIGPILAIIDALDESGDASGGTGLHAFLAKNLIKLPSNFRVVITSRPEHAIESVLVDTEVVLDSWALPQAHARRGVEHESFDHCLYPLQNCMVSLRSDVS